MIPIKQTILHDPANGQHGNCLSAVLASLLHYPIAQIPVFADTTWKSDLNRWLRQFGLAYLELSLADRLENYGIEGLHHEICGLTQRSGESNTLHACVGLDGVVIHDPHPDNSGLTSTEGTIGVFIALNPWKFSHNMSESQISENTDETPVWRRI